MTIKTEVFGLMKTLLDAHTMGINASAGLLRDCGYKVFVAPERIEDALDKISDENHQKVIIDWIKENRICRLGISYRLDPNTAIEIVGRMVAVLKREGLYESSDAIVQSIHFAGLAPACEYLDKEYEGRIKTFKGGETAEETLIKMGVPVDEIPKMILEGCKYDKELVKFGKDLIERGEYTDVKPLQRIHYSQYGTTKDLLTLRLDNNFEGGFQPLIRAHSGPYSPDKSRRECIEEYKVWCRDLSASGYLDILSIGTSQLSQSNFGESWGNRLNGGGVPINSESEYNEIWKSANPMLVRTYSATKNVLEMSKMYERTINNAWNALSLWWFDELDGRGPNNLYNNLCEHIETIEYVGKIGKPVETNVPHHFAFRGCDDITYIVSAYIAAKMTKKCGVKTFVLQNMLNTPRSTWGVQDIAKSRALIRLINSLRDDSFRVVLQTRAGLDYFKPDLEQAKSQLAAVTAMMDDIDDGNRYSPEIIHVVSYSEAMFLATPDVLNDSIKITRKSLEEYRARKNKKETFNVHTDDFCTREDYLYKNALKIINAMEKSICDLYSPEGLYLAFVAGWFPVPELWSSSSEFYYAKLWQTKNIKGGVELVDREVIMDIDTRINRCVSNLPNAVYMLAEKYGVNVELNLE